MCGSSEQSICYHMSTGPVLELAHSPIPIPCSLPLFFSDGGALRAAQPRLPTLLHLQDLPHMHLQRLPNAVDAGAFPEHCNKTNVASR